VLAGKKQERSYQERQTESSHGVILPDDVSSEMMEERSSGTA
jgi:hypothetical protein